MASGHSGYEYDPIAKINVIAIERTMLIIGHFLQKNFQICIKVKFFEIWEHIFDKFLC